MVEESHVHVKEVVDLSHDCVKVILYVDTDTCVLWLARCYDSPLCAPEPLQSNNVTQAHDLKRHTRDIARDSQGIEDEIRAMVSSYMAPKDDEDQELAIGRLVCWLWLDTYQMSY